MGSRSTLIQSLAAIAIAAALPSTAMATEAAMGRYTPESPVNFSLSWAPEFGVKNRLQGNSVYFNVSGASSS